jgi:hypothetical protein
MNNIDYQIVHVSSSEDDDNEILPELLKSIEWISEK